MLSWFKRLLPVRPYRIPENAQVRHEKLVKAVLLRQADGNFRTPEKDDADFERIKKHAF